MTTLKMIDKVISPQDNILVVMHSKTILSSGKQLISPRL